MHVIIVPGLKCNSLSFIKYVTWVSAQFLYPLRGPGMKKAEAHTSTPTYRTETI